MFAYELDTILQQYNTENITDDRYGYILCGFSKDYNLKRKNAAGIIHGFMKFILKIPDITDEAELKRAECLKDLYDCAKCVNDICQVYLREIMKPKYVLKSGDGNANGRTVIFGNEDEYEYSAGELDGLMLK